MKIKKLLFLSLLSVFLVSCIKREALNMEADVLTATVPNQQTILQTDPTITNTSVTFQLSEFDGNYKFAPQFTLTPGATIAPASGTTLDFTQPQTYTVKSQDGKWTKQYTVSFVINSDTELHLFSFENVDLINGHYDQFFDYNGAGQKVNDWSTANSGYDILAPSQVPAGQTLGPTFYPTYQTPDGYVGKGAVLQTLSTGSLGALLNSPMAAGNLFLGAFQLTFPSILSPHFGVPYNFKNAPAKFEGYYKYKAGPDFKVNCPNGSTLTKDTFDAYCILFEKSDQNNYLPGDFNFVDPREVMIARLGPADKAETDQWTKFSVPFVNLNGKSFDPTKQYMYTIVFTSSLEGGIFNGAVGSKLYVDEVRVVTADEQ